MLAPFDGAGRETRAAGFGELPEQPVARAELAELAAEAGLDVLAEDRAGRGIGRAHGQVRLERHDARGEARENDGEVGPLGLGGLLRPHLGFAGPPQSLRHVVEGVHEEAHLVMRGERQPGVEVAFCNRAGALHEVLDRLHQLAGHEDRTVPGGEQR